MFFNKFSTISLEFCVFLFMSTSVAACVRGQLEKWLKFCKCEFSTFCEKLFFQVEFSPKFSTFQHLTFNSFNSFDFCWKLINNFQQFFNRFSTVQKSHNRSQGLGSQKFSTLSTPPTTTTNYGYIILYARAGKNFFARRFLQKQAAKKSREKNALYTTVRKSENPTEQLRKKDSSKSTKKLKNRNPKKKIKATSLNRKTNPVIRKKEL